jgi:hypothetical protein
VLLGKGDGTFADPVNSPAKGYTRSMLLSDLNGDGKPDVVLAGEPGVSVLLGQGDGTFAAQVDSQAPRDMRAVALGDLNGDGKPDLVATWAGWAGVLVGSGVGTFGPSAGSLLTARYANSVVLGDLDHDGDLDIVTASGGAGTVIGAGTVSAYLGKGDGTFAAGTDYAAGDGLGSIVLGDVDGDGELDIAGVSGSTAGVLLGKGDGSFGPAAFYETTAEPVSALALGDVNGDGKLDIVVANAGVDFDWSAGVLLGNGDGTFAAEAEYVARSGPVAVALGDLNADGKLDIVLLDTKWSSDVASVLLGKGDGTFPQMLWSSLNSEGFASSVVLADVNGDSVVDIVTAGGVVMVQFGKGDGTFPSGVSYPVDASLVALGDLNGDGRLDLVTTGSGGLNVLLGSCQ